MRFILISLSFLLSSTVFAANTCEEQFIKIGQTQIEIQSIKIPDLTYTVNEENCSKVDDTLLAIDELVPKLSSLQKQYEVYYQNCDRSMDVIYAIEDVKINIILMQTLKDLANGLAAQCEA